jgi:hypothetical protein
VLLNKRYCCELFCKFHLVSCLFTDLFIYLWFIETRQRQMTDFTSFILPSLSCWLTSYLSNTRGSSAYLQHQSSPTSSAVRTIQRPTLPDTPQTAPTGRPEKNDTHRSINLLKPTGHVIHQQFNIQQLYVLPTLYLCVLYLSENKQRLVSLTA